MSDLTDRRSRKKAQTREAIRTVAHLMFAEQGFEQVTIADIARRADVAVQTVFNHFPTKEELFFDSRTPWVAGPADAVRNRPASVPPLSALREYLVETISDLVATISDEGRRCYVQTVEASDALRVHERELVHETEIRLRQALVDAWTGSQTPGAPVDVETAAALVAASWLSTARTMVVIQRPLIAQGADPADRAAEVAALADRMFTHLEAGVQLVHSASAPVTGWPTGIRRAG